MGKIVCFIDNYGVGTCGEESRGKVINYKKCGFYKKFKGKEKEFVFCNWKGEINKSK